MREAQVNNGVSFLTHANVQSAPISERIDFLRNKGLSQEEVDEAVRRASEKGMSPPSAPGGNVSTTAASSSGIVGDAQQQQQQQHQHQRQDMGSYKAPQREQPWWANVLIPGTLALSAGAGLAFLYRTMVLNERAPPFGANFGSWMGMAASPPLQPPLLPPPQPPQTPQQQPQSQHQQTCQVMDAAQSLYGQAPYASSAAEASTPTQIEPYSGLATTGSTLVPTPPSQLDRVAKAMERQAETLTSVCETLEKIVTQSAEQQEKQLELQLMKQKEAERQREQSHQMLETLLRSVLAGLSSSNANADIRSELASVKALLLAGANPSAVAAASAAVGTATQAHVAATTSPTTPETSMKDTMTTAVTTTAATAATTHGPPSMESLLRQASLESDDVKSVPEAAHTSQAVTHVPDGADAPTGQGQVADDRAKHEATRDEHIGNARKALATMVINAQGDNSESSGGALTRGLNMLLMYLNNLRKDPDVPRFRRIARMNSNYKSSLEPLKGHVEFLKALGFVEKPGGYQQRGCGMLEWSEEWLSNTNSWAYQVLDDAISNLEDVKGKVKPPSSFRTNAEVAGGAGTGSVSAPSVAASRPFGLQAQPVTGTEGMGDSIRHAMENNDNDSMAITDTNTEPGLDTMEGLTPPPPPQPLSYVEVMKLVQEGKTPDGIKTIPNKLSPDADELMHQPATETVRKPWESGLVAADRKEIDAPVAGNDTAESADEL